MKSTFNKMFSALYGVANCRQGVGRHISETQSPCRTQMSCSLNNNNPFLWVSPPANSWPTQRAARLGLDFHPKQILVLKDIMEKRLRL